MITISHCLPINFLLVGYLGLSQTDHINKMIIISVITLSGSHGI